MLTTTFLLTAALCIPGPLAQTATAPSQERRADDARHAAADEPRTAVRTVAPPARTNDPHHRIEVRFGGWTDGWYGYEHGWDFDDHDWQSTGNAQGAFGLEYLSFVRNDIGLGLGVSGLANARGDWGGWHQSGEAQVTVAIPVVVRWYPARRLTAVRSLEPYVTAGLGPVFGVDTQSTTLDVSSRWWRQRESASTRVATGVGGRVGGGVDLRLGSIFTLGVAGAWNWDAGLPDDLWRGTRPNGGEFALVLGWTWR